MWFRRILLAFVLAFSAVTFTASPATAQAQTQPAEPRGNESLGYGKTNADFQAWRSYFTAGNSTCWGCTLFSATAEATVEIGEAGIAAFAGPARSAVAAFMGLWVMWQLYLMLSVSHANSPAQSIDTIVTRLVVMMVVMWLLGNNNIFTQILTPFMNTLGAVMSSAQDLLPNGGSNYGGCAPTPGPGYVQEGNELLCSMQKELGSGLALGTWMTASAEFSFTGLGSFDIQQWFMGLVIIVVFAFMMVILPFRFFDAMVRIATVAAILPIVVLAFLFKPTRGAVKQAATSLLTAMLMFLFTAIAMAIAIRVLSVVTADIYTGADASTGRAFGGISGSDFMVLLTATLGMASMISSAGTLAAEFAGFQGQMGNAGSQGANAITGVANLAGKGAGGVAGTAFTANRIGGSVAGAMKAGTAG